MKISEIYGKIVESVSGKRGYVLRIMACRGEIECFICADEDEREFVVDMRSVKSIGEKIIYEDRESAMSKSHEISLGRASYDAQGNYLGNLEEFTFSGNRLLKAKIGKKSYSAAELYCNDAIIVNDATRLSGDVKRGNRVLMKKGAALTEESWTKASLNGEYIQMKLKSL